MPRPIVRLTRRTLLTDFGAAGVGLIVLGACGGSSGSSSAPPSSAATDVEPTDPVTTTAPMPEEATSSSSEPESSVPDEGAESGGELRLQHVSLGFVSAYVLVRGSEAAIVDSSALAPDALQKLIEKRAAAFSLKSRGTDLVASDGNLSYFLHVIGGKTKLWKLVHGPPHDP